VKSKCHFPLFIDIVDWGFLLTLFFFFFFFSLAYCEVYLMAALVALQIIPRARLVDTTIEDLTYDHDLIVLQTKKGSISVKIQIE
jgi:hypothetical protein